MGALSVRFLVEAADSIGSASIFECFVPADSKMPAPHSHDAFEETIYGLEGTTTWTVDGGTLDIGPSDAFCVPRGAVHGFDNNGTVDAQTGRLLLADGSVFNSGCDFIGAGETRMDSGTNTINFA